MSRDFEENFPRTESRSRAIEGDNDRRKKLMKRAFIILKISKTIGLLLALAFLVAVFSFVTGESHWTDVRMWGIFSIPLAVMFIQIWIKKPSETDKK